MVGAHNAQQRIMDAALTLFLEHGTHGTPVPEILSKAGAGAGSFYRYFNSKEQAANSIILKVKIGFLSALAKAKDPAKPVRLQIHEAFKLMVQYARQHPREAFFAELHCHGDYINEENANLQLRIDEILREMFQKAGQEGFLRLGKLELPLAIYSGAFLGLLRGHATGVFTLSDDEIEWIESGCWRAIIR